MPNGIVKSFAKKADTTTKKVERLWNKSEKLVTKKYDLTPEEDSDRFYALVVSVLKKILGIDKPKDIKEEDGGGESGDVGSDSSGITTSNLGGYQYYSRFGDMLRRISPDSKKLYKKLEKESSTKETSDNLAKRIKLIVDRLNGLKESTDILDDYIEHFSTKSNDVDLIIEQTLTAVEKKLGLTKSVFDK